ncbi:hypothetical protein WJ43_10575 [Burkholderia ubonensis]|nr:hypothetical protein WJ43_10575 [Burkholderia ubonensis]
MHERTRGKRVGVLRRIVASEKDQPMIESVGRAVYEAIVRRKSHQEIWAARVKVAAASFMLSGE